jgi:hypothetical protein
VKEGSSNGGKIAAGILIPLVVIVIGVGVAYYIIKKRR